MGRDKARAMTAVPHSAFVASFPMDAEFDHPPGAALARALESGLRERSFNVSQFDNWRDCGWVLNIAVDGKPFELYFTAYGNASEPSWLLAAAPLNQPGALARLFGRKAPDVIPELRALSVAVHELLSAHPSVSDLRWFLGGPPDKVPSHASPQELAWPSQP